MKQSEKLDALTQKINALADQKKSLEDEMIQSISKQVAAILIKKRATKIDISAFLKKIDAVVDEMNDPTSSEKTEPAIDKANAQNNS
jgi:hypothetical protein